MITTLLHSHIPRGIVSVICCDFNEVYKFHKVLKVIERLECFDAFVHLLKLFEKALMDRDILLITVVRQLHRDSLTRPCWI